MPHHRRISLLLIERMKRPLTLLILVVFVAMRSFAGHLELIKTFGIGVVAYKNRETVEDVVYAKPIVRSDTIAILKKWKILFPEQDVEYYTKAILVEFGYEDNGFPILGF